jgi:hypothetical protein
LLLAFRLLSDFCVGIGARTEEDMKTRRSRLVRIITDIKMISISKNKTF